MRFYECSQVNAYCSFNRRLLARLFISTTFFEKFDLQVGWMILIYYVAMQSRHCTRKWSTTKQKKLQNWQIIHILIFLSDFAWKSDTLLRPPQLQPTGFFYVPEWWRASISTKWIFIYDFISAAPFLSFCMIFLWTFTLKNRKKIHVNLNGAIFATFFQC